MYRGGKSKLGIEKMSNEFSSLGVGVGSYFQLLRNLIILFLILSVVNLPMVIIMVASNRVHKTEILNFGGQTRYHNATTTLLL